ncbi:twin-arginine translocation signal domain-containing protein [Pedobacter frigiditerrae]|uniref:Twin-arginine translocation signal domain-containing protein n=1 Tax=Pedobacter frigiditerrae TaxID=2530452 RepID=A0A4R0N3N4_9SPHI|nr:TIM barrel protein [Pedobacter frigiditerrae]TCC94488.1 twin-arginine translocation signal domain-containing protein [Pedobacter frigiditerrae]
MNSRRTFLKQTGLLAAGIAVAPSFACTLPKKHPIGLQLYSLRDVIKNDIKGIISKVAAIGYKEVETYGYSVKDGFWGLNAKAFNSLLKENSIKAPSGHYDLDNFMSGKGSDSLKSYIEAANIIGSEYITVPYLGDGIRKTVDDYKKLSEKLNEGARLCKASGLKFAYHNHDFEFSKFGDTTAYEIMLNNTDKNLVDFELDLYWAVRSNADPLALFKAHPGRFKMFHIKDIDKTNKNVNTEVGQGAVDFKAIFTGAKTAGVKHYFVEHEFNYKPDELGSIKTSFNYVNNELL